MTQYPGDLSAWALKHHVSIEAMQELQNIFYSPPEGDAPEGSEAMVQSRLRLQCQPLDAILWRNNQGACTDDTGRLIRYGLGHDSKPLNDVFKSSDLIGITPVHITPWHVGLRLGIFTAVEVKKPGWQKPGNDREIAQMNFLQNVAKFGGMAMFATDTVIYNNTVSAWRNV